MPELPEVETIIRDLNKKILNRKIQDVWFNWPKMIKRPSPLKFKNKIIGSKIKKVSRIGKNILFDLNSGKVILIHQKMTGHLLFGRWIFKNNEWISKEKGPLSEKVNSYIHLIFFLDNGDMLGLSDVRKFAKVLLFDKKDQATLKDIKFLGPDPLGDNFTFKKFKDLLKGKKGKIKKVLMDQNFIAGIGNIYSDEILWDAGINPLKDISKLAVNEQKRIFNSTKKVLKKAIVLRGTSISDYRDTAGKPGRYDLIRKVYRREGKKCPRCKAIIKKFKIGGRSGHYCPKCQK